ncbi:MAG: aldo/keto reductase [Planctomycetes bacterium]|nr:aldo/keto reductase [Planctomycetota bacterium]
MKRRTFLKAVGSIATGGTLGVQSILGAERPTSKDRDEKVAGLPRRVLGRTGQKVSIVGFPGLALIHYDQDRCNTGLHDAFKRGVNYFDVAPAYGNGEAEIKMGIGLQGIDRSRIFLACKTKMRDKEGARKELERSLERLKTDYFDLYQLHHLRWPEEVKQALGPNGAMETILKAKEQGKIKYLGFSAHTTKGALEAMKGFRFDTVMFPINFVEFFKMGFGKPILELANKQGAAVLAIKPLSKGAWPEGAERTRKWWYRTTETQDEVNLAMRFTLSQKCVVAGIPPSFLDLLDKAIEAGRSYNPITKDETQKLQEMAKTCESVFRREEEQVARGGLIHQPVYPDSPHECCPCAYA